jgi:D-alanine-D-alanine ligase
LAEEDDDDVEQLLAEAYVAGRELSVAVIGEGDAARSLGVIEIQPVDGFYDYEAKYERADTTYVVDPDLPDEVTRQLSENAVRAHRLLECRGVTRIDFRWDGAGEPLLLEVNTLPGLTSHSLVPKIAAAAGVSYGELVERIVEDAALTVWTE